MSTHAEDLKLRLADYDAAIEAIANGSIKVEPLISAVANLQDGNDWFQRLQKNEEDLMKVILKP